MLQRSNLSVWNGNDIRRLTIGVNMVDFSSCLLRAESTKRCCPVVRHSSSTFSTIPEKRSANRHFNAFLWKGQNTIQSQLKLLFSSDTKQTLCVYLWLFCSQMWDQCASALQPVFSIVCGPLAELDCGCPRSPQTGSSTALSALTAFTFVNYKWMYLIRYAFIKFLFFNLGPHCDPWSDILNLGHLTPQKHILLVRYKTLAAVWNYNCQYSMQTNNQWFIWHRFTKVEKKTSSHTTEQINFFNGSYLDSAFTTDICLFFTKLSHIVSHFLLSSKIEICTNKKWCQPKYTLL